MPETKDHSGFLLIDKPENWSSHDVVDYLRKQIGIKKIGHAGTLDPFATGLLLVGVGREATKRLSEFQKLPKTYLATLMLGAVSSTFDKTGDITVNANILVPTQETIQDCLNFFIGKQMQTPPMFSAKKINGKKLYELARQGIEIERKACEINITSINLLEYTYPQLSIQISCSSGTYIRTLAHDIGQRLNTGAYCKELTRVAIGAYTQPQAILPQEVTFSHIRHF